MVMVVNAEAIVKCDGCHFVACSFPLYNSCTIQSYLCSCTHHDSTPLSPNHFLKFLCTSDLPSLMFLWSSFVTLPLVLIRNMYTSIFYTSEFFFPTSIFFSAGVPSNSSHSISNDFISCVTHFLFIKSGGSKPG